MWILLRSVLPFFLCFLPFSFHLLFLSICFLLKRITLITLHLLYSLPFTLYTLHFTRIWRESYIQVLRQKISNLLSNSHAFNFWDKFEPKANQIKSKITYIFHRYQFWLFYIIINFDLIFLSMLSAWQ